MQIKFKRNSLLAVFSNRFFLKKKKKKLSWMDEFENSNHHMDRALNISYVWLSDFNRHSWALQRGATFCCCQVSVSLIWIQLIFHTVTFVWQQSHNEMPMTTPVLLDPRQSEETEQSYILLRPLESPVLSECFLQLMKVEERSTLSFFFWHLVRCLRSELS